MKSKLLTILITFLLFGMSLSCKKSKLTKETQNGANTFSCLINGHVYKPCESGAMFFAGDPLYGGYSNDFKTVRISAVCYEKKPQKALHIELTDFHGVGEYLLSDSNNLCYYQEYYPDRTYSSSLTKNGKVVITHEDRGSLIISGRFECIAQNTTNVNDKITITSGRFDVDLW